MITLGWLIYALVDPRTSEVRYVGFTTDLAQRMRDHRGCHKRLPRADWYQSMRRAGYEPIPAILEQVTEGTWREAEVRWIAYYRALGARLLNCTEGGDGVALHSAETVERCREAGRRSRGFAGRTHSTVTRAKIAAAKTGAQMSPEARRTMSAAAYRGWEKRRAHAGS